MWLGKETLPIGSAKRGRSEWGGCGHPHGVPTLGSPLPGWVPVVVQYTLLLGQGDASRSLAMAVGLFLQRAGCGVGWLGRGCPMGKLGSPKVWGPALGLSLWL